MLNDLQTENKIENKIENTSPHTPRLSLSCNSLDSNIKNSKLIAQRSMKKNRTNSVNLVTVLEEKNLITPHNLFTPQKSLRNFEEDNNIREKSEKSEKGEKSEKNEGICNPLPYFSPIKSIDISRDRISLSSRVDDNVNEMDTVIDLIQKTIPQMQMSEERYY